MTMLRFGTKRRDSLLSAGKIGSLKLPNRIIVTAIGARIGNPDGTVGERLIDYHVAQASGGAGLIITGVAGVAWPVGAVTENQIAISDDRFLPGLAQLVNSVHAAGGRIAAQLHHGGLNAYTAAREGHPLWAPAPPPDRSGDFMQFMLSEEKGRYIRGGEETVQVKILDHAAIQLVVSQFADAAVRAKVAGFDGVEIHGGHGYLLASFLSPSTNFRTDPYGGILENRARLLLEVVRAARAAVGPEFPLWVKLDSREIGKDNGITLDQTCRVATWVQNAGADAITVTSYHDVKQGRLASESYTPHEPGAHIEAARTIGKRLDIPVIASGRIELSVGNAAVAAGQFDFLAMGRKILADPFLPKKLAEGREQDIRPCIYCYTCASTGYLNQPVRCAVRPETGFEDRQWTPSSKRRRIVIIGSGPGGMEAARRLVGAGHEVILLEKRACLGGTLLFAGLAYEPNERLLEWLRGQITRSSIDVRLRTEATPALVASLEPDFVLVATGAVRAMPPIPGSDLDHVLSGDDLQRLMLGDNIGPLKGKTRFPARFASKLGRMTGATRNLAFVRKATHFWMPLGSRITIIGGELVGLELAEFLTDRGRKVSVVGEEETFGRGLPLVRRMRLLSELRDHDVKLFAGSSAIRITRDAVEFADAGSNSRRIASDHVIVACGARPDVTIADALRRNGLKVLEYGDCSGIGYIEGAIRSAAEIVSEI